MSFKSRKQVRNLLIFFSKLITYFKFILVRLFILSHGDVEKKFSLIYKLRYWSGTDKARSVSGYGSEEITTKNISRDLEIFLKDYKIESMLDLPCGDFNWMKKINLDNIKYIGGDIVPDLISENKKKFESKNISFIKLDILKDSLPSVDLIFTRDCFIHLSNMDIIGALKNVKKSKSKYFATTSFNSNTILNNDIKTGDFRFINLESDPFNLPKPEKILNDSFDNKDLNYSKKSILIWKVDNLNYD